MDCLKSFLRSFDDFLQMMVERYGHVFECLKFCFFKKLQLADSQQTVKQKRNWEKSFEQGLQLKKELSPKPRFFARLRSPGVISTVWKFPGNRS